MRDLQHQTLPPSDFQRRNHVLDAIRDRGDDPTIQPSNADVAMLSCLTLEQVTRIRQAPVLTYLSASVVDEDSDGKLGDFLPDDSTDVENEVPTSMGVSAVTRYGLSALDRREPFVVIRRFGLHGDAPQSLAEIGHAVRLSREAVRKSKWPRCGGSDENWSDQAVRDAERAARAACQWRERVQAPEGGVLSHPARILILFERRQVVSSSVPLHRWHRRGHGIVSYADRRWRWASTGRWLRYGSGPDDPAFVLCDRSPTPEGYDPCLGEVPGAKSACCGHGVTGGHVSYPDCAIINMPRLRSAPETYPYPMPAPSAQEVDHEADDGEDRAGSRVYESGRDKDAFAPRR